MHSSAISLTPKYAFAAIAVGKFSDASLTQHSTHTLPLVTV